MGERKGEGKEGRREKRRGRGKEGWKTLSSHFLRRDYSVNSELARQTMRGLCISHVSDPILCLGVMRSSGGRGRSYETKAGSERDLHPGF